jgi:hypothetical protein
LLFFQTPWILALIFSYCDMSDDSRWRLLLGLGAVPAFFVVVCSVLETRAAESQEKAEDISASHALLSPAHADQFHHHPDGGIGHSSHNSSSNSSSISSTQGPFHTSSLSSSGAGLLVDRKGEAADSERADTGGKRFREYLNQKGTWIKLMVTGGGWFIYDVAYCKLPTFLRSYQEPFSVSSFLRSSLCPQMVSTCLAARS